MRLVKVLWQHRGVEEETWECKGTMRATYHFLFKDEGALSSLILGTRINYCICMCLCVQVCVDFGNEILLKEEECKTREKFNFYEKWEFRLDLEIF